MTRGDVRGELERGELAARAASTSAPYGEHGNYGYGVLYVYFTPSQGSANRLASGRVLGAMARPVSANLGFIPPLRLITLDLEASRR